MHADGPRAVGPHGKPVEASASTTASDVGDIWKSVSKNLNPSLYTKRTFRRAVYAPARSRQELRGQRGNPLGQ